MIYTGMRRGEILGIRWEDIDFATDMIREKQSVYFLANQAYIGPPKSKAGDREIPLLPERRTILEPLRQTDGYIINKGGCLLTEREKIRDARNEL